jgi:hypothetical protein
MYALIEIYRLNTMIEYRPRLAVQVGLVGLKAAFMFIIFITNTYLLPTIIIFVTNTYLLPTIHTHAHTTNKTPPLVRVPQRFSLRLRQPASPWDRERGRERERARERVGPHVSSWGGGVAGREIESGPDHPQSRGNLPHPRPLSWFRRLV